MFPKILAIRIKIFNAIFTNPAINPDISNDINDINAHINPKMIIIPII